MLKQFTVGAAHTLNLGNYESMRIEASVTWDVPEGAEQTEYDRLKTEAQAELRRLLEHTYKAQRRERKKNEPASES